MNEAFIAVAVGSLNQADGSRNQTPANQNIAEDFVPFVASRCFVDLYSSWHDRRVEVFEY